eukprot:TRINITY_DN10457_c1_g1_i1.p2 TRINITY_DN10457_c1_g1~~TRINITY_DN10457_c1_g1_i1.p2  ORF type:complete len:180 (-),score=11.85 TRINITY_DN10457_c1_g1_i1:242-781(-)
MAFLAAVMAADACTDNRWVFALVRFSSVETFTSPSVSLASTAPVTACVTASATCSTPLPATCVLLFVNPRLAIIHIHTCVLNIQHADQRAACLLTAASCSCNLCSKQQRRTTPGWRPLPIPMPQWYQPPGIPIIMDQRAFVCSYARGPSCVHFFVPLSVLLPLHQAAALSNITCVRDGN